MKKRPVSVSGERKCLKFPQRHKVQYRKTFVFANIALNFHLGPCINLF